MELFKFRQIFRRNTVCVLVHVMYMCVYTSYMCEVYIAVIMHRACLMYHERLCVSNESHLSSVVYTLTGTGTCTCTVHVLGCCRVVVALAISLARSSSRALCISTIHHIMIMSQGVWHTRLSHDRTESAQLGLGQLIDISIINRFSIL